VADPDDEDEGPELPLEGATCAAHGDRAAFRVCPVCNKNACLACWHPSISRCHACLMKDAKAFPPVPWEDRSRSLPVRFVLNALSALSPDSGAPGFARESDTTGAVFAVLTLVPLGLASGIIPYTRTLLFGPAFDVQVTHGADSHAIAMDVLVAAFTGLLVTVLSWLAVALPYVSLSRAYADRGMATAPVRVMNYRGWLIPLFLTLSAALPCCLPAPVTEMSFLLARLLAVVPIVLLLAAMRSVARMGSGAGPIATFAILIVPLTLMFIAQGMLEPLQPDSAEIQAAAGVSSDAPTEPSAH
jgi:hypothetical protein